MPLFFLYLYFGLTRRMHVHVLCASMFAVASVWLNPPHYGFNMYILCPCLSALFVLPCLPLKVEECRAEVEQVVRECERSGVEHEQQIADLANTLQMYQVSVMHTCPHTSSTKALRMYFIIITTQTVTCYTCNSTVLYTLLTTVIRTYVHTGESPIALTYYMQRTVPMYCT